MTGFVDGQGTFTYSRSGKQLALYFAVKLPAEDEPLLRALQDFFGGIGRIYAVAGRTPARYLRVSHRDELASIVDHFDRYPLQTRKRESFAVWRSMVEIKRKFRHPDREQLAVLAAQLSAASGRLPR